MIDIRQARRPVARMKASWSDPWTDLVRGSFSIDSVTEGSSAGLGSAELLTIEVGDNNREEDAPAPPALEVDHFVQIGAEDPTRAEDDDDRIRWLWIGVVAERSWEHDGTEFAGTGYSFVVRYRHRLEGLGSLLARVTVSRCQVAVNGAAVSLERCIGHNTGEDGAIRGNRTASEIGGRYLHNLDRGATTTLGIWTAQQVIATVLTDHLNSTTFAAWPTFQIGGQLDALNYADVWDLHGMSIDQAMTLLAGPGRGCAWTIEPDASGTGPVTIRITSGLTAAVSVPDGVSLPASDRIVSSADTGASHFRWRSSLVDRARRWTLEGVARSTLTVRFSPTGAAGALIRGWPAGRDANAGDVFDSANFLVWRFFRFNPHWNGANHGSSSGMATNLLRNGTDYDGTRSRAVGTFVASAALPTGDCLFPPIGSNDGTAADPIKLNDWCASAEKKLPGDCLRERVRVFVRVANVTQDVTELFSISVVTDPAPGILFGNSPEDGKRMADLVGSSTGELLVTLTFTEPLPVLISREPADAGNDARVATESALHQVMDGTVVGVLGVAPVVVQGTRVVRDDRPRLWALLTGLGPYLDRKGTAEIVDRSEIYAANNRLRPGALLRTVEDGRGPDCAISVDAVVTARTWTFAPGSYGTTIALEPLILDIRSYL